MPKRRAGSNPVPGTTFNSHKPNRLIRIGDFVPACTLVKKGKS
jgi:hypothetical protein